MVCIFADDGTQENIPFHFLFALSPFTSPCPLPPSLGPLPPPPTPQCANLFPFLSGNGMPNCHVAENAGIFILNFPSADSIYYIAWMTKIKFTPQYKKKIKKLRKALSHAFI